eukprot:m.56832 g.56832  ORF g.56832 m.56832 type:complete len:74 (+) comp13034_c1_seq1:816-1037(+)
MEKGAFFELAVGTALVAGRGLGKLLCDICAARQEKAVEVFAGKEKMALLNLRNWLPYYSCVKQLRLLLMESNW